MNELKYLSDLSNIQYLFMVLLPPTAVALSSIVAFVMWRNGNIKEFMDSKVAECLVALTLIPAVVLWAYYDGQYRSYEMFSKEIEFWSFLYVFISIGLVIATVVSRYIFYVIGAALSGFAARYFWTAWGQEVSDHWIVEDYSPFHMNRTLAWLFTAATAVLVIIVLVKELREDVEQVGQDELAARRQLASDNGSYPS